MDEQKWRVIPRTDCNEVSDGGGRKRVVFALAAHAEAVRLRDCLNALEADLASLRTRLEAAEAKTALADEAEDLLIERLDAYPEDWSPQFAQEIQDWRTRYDALQESSTEPTG